MYKKLLPVYSIRLVKELINKGFLIQDVRTNNKHNNYKVYMFIDTEEIREVINDFK